MTTKQNDVVTIGANGLVRVCAYCVPPSRLEQLHRAHRCTDGICGDCEVALYADMDRKRAMRADVSDVERVIEESARQRRAA